MPARSVESLHKSYKLSVPARCVKSLKKSYKFPVQLELSEICQKQIICNCCNSSRKYCAFSAPKINHKLHMKSFSFKCKYQPIMMPHCASQSGICVTYLHLLTDKAHAKLDIPQPFYITNAGLQSRICFSLTIMVYPNKNVLITQRKRPFSLYSIHFWDPCLNHIVSKHFFIMDSVMHNMTKSNNRYAAVW